MITKINQKNNDSLSILGLGCMRLPKAGGRIDEERSIKMIRRAVEGGINYFDTAYVYSSGQNEVILGKALAGGYRERVKIATKLPCYILNSLANAEKIFASQLEKLQTNRVDYYLMHMLTDLASFTKMKDLGVIEFFENMKKEGKILNLGFSFHGSKKDFEEILKAYSWDFCQIQYNYMDENFQATKSGLELAGAMGIPVIIMEPLRGGQLTAKLPAEAIDEFKSFDPSKTPAEWGLRWVWNHPQVNLLLSGMSDEMQLEENMKIAATARENSMSPEELELVDRVKDIILSKMKIPCTACDYCMPCPFGVNIPGCFSIYNDKHRIKGYRTYFKYTQILGGYSKKTAFASNCTKCGKCESHCPQSIPIRDNLEIISREIENPIFRLVMKVVRKFMKLS